MRHTIASLRGFRPTRFVTVALVVLAVMLVVAASAAIAVTSVPAPPAHPTSASQIQNVDQVKTAIKAYYGDTVSSQLDPVNGTTLLHFASPTSAYAKEMHGIEKEADTYLGRAIKGFGGHHVRHAGQTPAVVFDIDDTTLNTFSYEIYSNFVFNPTTNAAFVNAGVFPAVFGMPQLVDQAQADGYTVFFLTGRPVSQLAGTKANLQSVGYPTVQDSQLYLRDNTAPWLASCGGSTCTTDQYKSLTRQHIESLGYDIVGNFGDQFSDLSNGFEDRKFKLPNPMYFLP
jgi:acid phosphatase class B